MSQDRASIDLFLMTVPLCQESVKRGNRNSGRNVYQKKVDQKYFIHKSNVLIGSAASAKFLEQLVGRQLLACYMSLPVSVYF